jgi:hypothetical protein
MDILQHRPRQLARKQLISSNALHGAFDRAASHPAAFASLLAEPARCAWPRNHSIIKHKILHTKLGDDNNYPVK